MNNFGKETFRNVVALIVLVFCFAYLFAISFMPANVNVKIADNVSDIKIAIISAITLILGFYFGSSSASHSKDETINTFLRSNEIKSDVKDIKENVKDIRDDYSK